VVADAGAPLEGDQQPGLDPEVERLVAEVRAAAPALAQVVRRVRGLAESGVLDAAMELLELAAALRASLTDEMVVQLADKARVGLEFLDAVMRSDLPARMPALAQAADEAALVARESDEHIGPLSLLGAFRQPEVQYLLRYASALVRRLPPALGLVDGESGASPSPEDDPTAAPEPPPAAERR
jgi:uncharacterized protein YjgD (DUF1641 family)